MRLKQFIRAALCSGALLALSTTAHAITISGVSDADGSALNFDISANSQSTVGNVTTISLGLNAFKAEAPVAVGPTLLPFDLAFDTIQLTITADPGSIITSLGMAEVWNVQTGANSYAAIDASVAVAGQGTKGFDVLYNPGNSLLMESGSINPDFVFAGGLQQVVVTITNSLTAFSATGQQALIEKISSELTVETAPIPLPVPILLLGSALAGMVMVSRKRALA